MTNLMVDSMINHMTRPMTDPMSDTTTEPMTDPKIDTMTDLMTVSMTDQNYVRAVSHYCDAWIHMQGVIMNSAASDNHASLWCVASHNPIGDNTLINKDWANCLENQSYVFNWNIGIVALAPQRKSRIRNYIIVTVYCYHHDHHDHHFDHDHWDRRDFDKISVPTVSISKWIPRQADGEDIMRSQVTLFQKSWRKWKVRKILGWTIAAVELNCKHRQNFQ